MSRSLNSKLYKISHLFDSLTSFLLACQPLRLMTIMTVFFTRVLQPAKEPPISELGLDAYLELPSAKDFTEALKTKKGAIKALLLDQVLNSSPKFLCGDASLSYDVCVND